MHVKILKITYIYFGWCLIDNADGFELGRTTIDYDGISMPIYNRESLLIELIRNKRKFAFDLYKELILGYCDIIRTLDIEMVSDYTFFVTVFLGKFILDNFEY